MGLYKEKYRVALSLEGTQHEAAKALAAKKTWTLTTLIQQALAEYLKREAKRE